MNIIQKNIPYFNQKFIVRILTLIVFVFILTSCNTTPILHDSNQLSSASKLSNLQGGNFVQTEEVVIGLLIVAAIVSIATQRLRIPYSIGLVLVGFGLTFVNL
jgi:hypothetical protein